MMLQEKVLILSNPATNKYYESLGYIFPRSYDNQKRLRIPTGTRIEIKISDLQPESNIKVLCKCDNIECSSEPKMIIFQSLNRIDGKYYCHSCSMKQQETREKVRQKQTGKKHKIDSIAKMKANHPRLGKFGKDNPTFGRHHTEEVKRKISDNSFFRGKTGKLSPLWNSNLTDDERKVGHRVPKYGWWKISVKNRDNHICQCCKYIGSKYDGVMVSHHLNNFCDFKEQRTDIDNGITLCKDCHNLLHKVYGKKTTKKHFIEFLKNYSKENY